MGHVMDLPYDTDAYDDDRRARASAHAIALVATLVAPADSIAHLEAARRIDPDDVPAVICYLSTLAAAGVANYAARAQMSPHDALAQVREAWA